MNSGNRKKQALLDDLDKLGYGLFRPEESVNFQRVFKGLLESKDPRLLEGFPIATSSCSTTKGEPNYCDFDSLIKWLPDEKRQETSLQLLYLSFLTFMLYDEKKELASNLKELFKKRRVLRRFKQIFDSKFINSSNVQVSDTQLDLGRMKEMFLNFIFTKQAREQKTLVATLEFKRDLQTELFLSELFTPKQKEIIKKKLKGEKLTSSEAQYYSRVIKKRLKAIADDEVHKLAGSLIGKL